MGNTQTIPSNIEILRPQNWIEAGQDQQKALFPNVNPYRKRLLANIITQQLIEQYQLNFIAQQDYNNYIKQLSFRQISIYNQINKHAHNSKYISTPQFIYPIRYFINKSKHEMCTTIHTGYLYIDKVDLRLKQINDIPFSDLIYIYKATLNGFKFLYQKVGYFDIQEEMIFITKKGQVKVWMNANLAKNYPNFQRNNQNNSQMSQRSKDGSNEGVYGSQADMIRDLIYLIEKNSDQYTQYGQVQLFSQFLAQNNILDRLSFQHCLQQFQLYLHKNNLHCPNHMKSIPQLFSPQEHQTSHQHQRPYQQSHVKEITSHHLTQMKKKFQPMQTIAQNQNYGGYASLGNSNSKTHPKIIQNYHNNPNTPNYAPHNFDESMVSNFTPQKFTHRNYQHIGQQNMPTMMYSQKKNGSNSYQQNKNGQIEGLERSRYSQHSQKVNVPEIQFQGSGHKPNSVSNINYMAENNNKAENASQKMTRHNSNQGQIHNQSHTHSQVQAQNVNQPYNGSQVQVTNTNRTHQFSFSQAQNSMNMIQPQFYSGQNGQKVFICSPPPSFRVMGGINSNLNTSKAESVKSGLYNQTNNYSLPQTVNPTAIHPQISSMPYSQPVYPSQQLNHFSMSHTPMIKVTNPIHHLSINLPPSNNPKPISHLPPKYSPIKVSNPPPLPPNNQSPQKNPLLLNNSDPKNLYSNHKHKVDQIKNVEENQHNVSKSSIKYYSTKNNAYQLDEEIASDLEKFLGLKVN